MAIMGADLRPWIVDEVGIAPYSERARPDPRWWDIAVERAAAPLAARFARLFGRPDAIVAAVDAHRVRLADLSDGALGESARHLRADLVRGGFTLPLTGLAFAHVREATRRHLGYAHHPVQLMGGFVMLQGRLAEMQTGEGKTVTAILPAATAALAGVPVHVITVNDYLAQRDAEELRPIYATLGLTVGLVQNGQEPPDRRRAYAQDIAYCTNKELAFDYLRDRIASRERPSQRRALARRLVEGGGGRDPLLLRGLHFAIVDEADSVLIDEARTPLIISATSGDELGEVFYANALSVARRLEAGRDFILSPTERSVTLTEAGHETARSLAEGLEGLWRSRRAREELLSQALSALHLFHRDHQYIVAEEKVQIVDEYTGRVMPDRQWQRGLQQLIEIKEGCAASGGRETLAQITYQRFFRRYLWLGGMTGTAREVARELKTVYRLDVVPIPTHLPTRRVRRQSRTFRTAEDRWNAVVASTQAVTAEGRPVLIGTRSVSASELIAAQLAAIGLQPVVLNARQDAEEAEAVAMAGLEGQVTVATNIAGRGTDIRPAPAIVERGGLHVILTELHESPRIDRQLIGRTGRQGDRGTYEILVSLEDELFRAYAPWLARIAARFQRDSVVQDRIATALGRTAQARAERLHARTRTETFRRSSKMDKALGFVSWTE